MSTYTLKSGQTLWIITEADRSVTALLLPLELTWKRGTVPCGSPLFTHTMKGKSS